MLVPIQSIFEMPRFPGAAHLYLCLLIYQLVSGPLSVADEASSPLLVERLDQEWRLTSYKEEITSLRRRICDIGFEKDGTAWLAGSDGLYRYDGYYWKKFGRESGLPSLFVRQVLVTRDGTLWVGTDKGVGVFDGTSFDSKGSEKHLAGPSVRSIVEDPDGTLWFCSDLWPDASVSGGLTSYKNGEWKIYRESEGLPSSFVWDYFRASDGRQFAMTRKGLARKHEERWVPIERKEPRTVLPISMAESLSTHTLVVQEGKISVFQENEWEPKKAIASNASIPFPVISTLQGEIVTCSAHPNRQGLQIEKWNGVEFEGISPLFAPQEADTGIIVEAPDGAIWCGGRGMLVRLDRHGGEWTEYANLPPPRSLDEAGNPIFSDSGAAWRFDGQAFVRIESPVDTPAFRDADGNDWSIAPDESEAREARHGKLFRRHGPSNTGLKQCQTGCADAIGQVWLYGQDINGTNALSICSNGEWRKVIPPELNRGKVLKMLPDPRTGMWFLWANENGDRSSIVWVTAAETRSYMLGPIGRPCRSFIVQPGGEVWIWSPGLLELDKVSGQWTRVPEVAGNWVISSISREEQEWFILDGVAGGHASISLYSHGAWKNYPAEISAFGFIAHTADDGLYFSGKGRVYVVDPKSEGPPRQLALPTSGRVTNLIKDARGDLWLTMSDAKEGSVFRYRPDRAPPETEITQADLTVQEDGAFHCLVRGIGKLASSDSRKVFLFSWRLDGNAWTSFQPFLEEGIAGLRPGNHSFEIRSQDESGDIDPTPAKHFFSVTPKSFWEKTWFKPALVSGIALGMLGIYWSHRTRAREIERLRTRIASELHDEVGSSLGSILLMSQMAQKHAGAGTEQRRELSDINRIARQASNSVRDIVWFINPEYNTAGDLLLRMKDVAATMLVGIDYRLEVSELNLAKKLPLDFRKNIYLLFKEVLANIVKHSQATFVEIRLLGESGSVRLKVQDNGVGFNPTASTGGAGLNNIRRRAREMLGTVEIRSAPGEGVTVRFETRV